jgi:myo-inositol-1(or 4)-monophosphatase
MTHHDGSALCEVAVEAAMSVGPELRAAFGKIERVGAKANFHDLVTEADVAAETLIRQRLRAATPEAAIVGEELGSTGEAPLRWYIDPIDGTNNFAGGIPFFCVSIGAAVDGELVAGVILDPLRNELFVATESAALCNGEPLAARGASDDATATMVTGFPRHEPWADAPGSVTDFELFASMVYSFRTVRRLGSAALALAYVAAGRVDVSFGVNASPWDLAAGALMVSAAGGTFQPLVNDGSSVPAWASPAYLAHVGDFDPTRGCLADVVAGR